MMKNYILLLVFTLLITSISAQTPSVSADEEAIKQVIVTEFDAYIKRDFKTWADTYVDAPTTTFMVTDANTSGSLFAMSDFQKISKGMKGMFDSGSKSTMSLANRDGWLIRIKGEMAFAIYNEEFLMTNGTKIKSKTQKVMEKVKGKWKIATTSAICDFNNAIIPTPNPDEEAIKQVITDQSSAWANRDTTAYYACYANNDLTQSAYNNRNMSIGINLGFAELQKYVRDGIKASPNKFYQPNMERSNWVIKLLSPEWAWVNFTQKTKNVREQINTSYETRLMHREDGKWRINVVNALWDYKNVVQPAVNPDEEDIKKVIINETELWLDQKHDAWAESFVQAPYLTWSVTNGSEPGDGLTKRSWDSLDAYMGAWFKNDMSALTKEWRKAKMTREQWQIQIRGNVAFVSFNQHGESEKQKTDSTEERVLEKINGVWKIAMQATIADFKDAIPPIRSKY